MTDAEIYALTSPAIARLALAAMGEVAALRGADAPAGIDGALVATLNALADNITQAASGFDLYVAARMAGVYGEACSRVEAEAAWGPLALDEKELFVCVGYWSDRMNWQVRQQAGVDTL